MCFKGVSEQALDIAGIRVPADFSKKYEAPETWLALLQEWHTTLEKLANDYYRGIADVAPLYANTCDVSMGYFTKSKSFTHPNY